MKDEIKKNVKLVISYDGTQYNGSQSQLNGNTIEDKLKAIVSKINGYQTTIYFSSRTDSKVHAAGQTANFFTDKTNMNETNWLNAINSGLPWDIRILSCEFVDPDFQSRRNAIGRQYIYRLINASVISALENRYAVRYSHPLDISLLQEYCNYLIGEHDFSSFCSAGDTNPVKIRYLHTISITRRDNLITITIIGNAFLHNMIRIIVGTILKLHRFEEPALTMQRILEGKNRDLAGPTFKAGGLTLHKVFYDQAELEQAVKQCTVLH